MQWFGLSKWKKSNPEGKKQGAKRKRKFLYLLVLSLVFSLFTFDFSIAADARHYTDLKFPPLPEIKLPNYTRFVMDNGTIVYLMEDRELPLVNGTAVFRTGDRLEPSEKVGLGALMGEVMRTGGTKAHSPDQLNQMLEQRAAAIETGVSTADASADFSALSEDLNEVFSLFAEVVRQPVFSPEKLDLAKTQQRGGIARRNDSPNGIVAREFQKLVYGENSPYARTVEYSTVDNIYRDDLVDFYQKYFHPNNMILGIVGDFDSKAMRQLIEEKFGDWKPNPQLKIPPVPSASQAKTGGIFMVNQPQLTQSYIQMGHLGGQRNSPDYAALSVLNGVLNGFGGRLFNQVRSRQGLAYSVYGYWDAAYDYPGTFIAAGQTRSETTVPFIQAMLGEIKRLRSEPITTAELAYAKESVLNSFVFNFQDPSQTLSRLIRYEYYGYPNDFIFRFQKGVEATTIEDVKRVAEKYLQPENIVTLVVGNAAAIQPPLTSLTRNVTSVDITIPKPKNS
ncbi:insulinase family protein [Microcoleus sp. FACHB-831]|uniref:M16 family metallopeptidase n=1 Tax=Microcoleus sp. FACHB-831 TaxID=2692827 RepID=UPI00168A3695|nr:pitrilysin family protein [Microcoleus sp. FACHB-831]MBD1921936.1 insulinase family protein [Microcoleus sp. FACHB-831]